LLSRNGEPRRELPRRGRTPLLRNRNRRLRLAVRLRHYSPSFFIIDPQGVIRYKWAGAPGEKAMDAALEKVIQEAEDAKKPPE